MDRRSREPQPENRRPQRAATREDVKGLVYRLKEEQELNTVVALLSFAYTNTRETSTTTETSLARPSALKQSDNQHQV